VTIAALVARLRDLDVKVWLDGAELRVNAPAGALSPELRQELSSRRDELRAFLESHRSSAAALPALRPAPRGANGELPVSFAQERFLLIHSMDPASTAYSLQTAGRIRGALRVDGVRDAWAAVLARHEILRTTFHFGDGRAFARHRVQGNDLQLVGLEHLPLPDRDPEALRLIEEEARTPFDVHNGPLARIRLVRIAPDDHLLITNMHHVVWDQWSNGLLSYELATFYNAGADGRTAALPDLPVQYADFAAWQRAVWADGGWQEQLQYWRQQLAGAGTVELPSDRPRPAAFGSPGGLRQRKLPQAVLQRVARLAADRAVSASMIYLAAFFALLHRYTGQDDIVVGQPVAGRHLPGVEMLLGVFGNTLAIRASVEGDLRFVELLDRVRHVALDAYAHQDFPFDRLVAELGPSARTGPAPLVQVLFNVVTAQATPPTALQDMSWEPIVMDRGAAQFDVSLTVNLDGLDSVFADYNADMFDAARIDRMLEHYELLLASALEDPSKRVRDLTLLGESESETILRAWNRTETELPEHATLASLIDDQARRQPAAPAVRAAGRSLTRGELNEAANRLARYLGGQGVDAQTPVGVALDPSVDLAVALLAVLKTGATLVPLPVPLPQSRLAQIVSDSGLGLVVTVDRLASSCEDAGARCVRLDADRSVLNAEDGSDLLPPTGNDVACLLYVPAEAGTWVGVEVLHRALVNAASAMGRHPGLGADDVLLRTTAGPVAHLGPELLMPLAVGAALVIPTEDEVEDGVALAQVMADAHVTVLHADSRTLRLLLHTGGLQAPAPRVWCAYDEMSQAVAPALGRHVESVWHVWGVAETGGWTLVDRVGREDAATWGRPAANVRAYVLDSAQRPVPAGVPGELYIGGEGVASGYRHRPELTAARFVADPFTPGQGARLFRTGDRCRFLGDGRIEHIGRRDRQVSLRGRRVELGEIETALQAIPEIDDAAVVVLQDRMRLAAYVVFEPGEELTPSEVRRAVRATVPDHMVPSFVIPADSLPRSAAGAIVCEELPDPVAGARARGRKQAPQTGMEQAIATVWKAALQQDFVARSDNFFQLGGHSLLALQVIGRMQAATGVSLNLRDLFIDNLQQVAARCDELAAKADPGAAVPVGQRAEA
jgi:amino acid adenylation domain-containing protein